MDPIASGITLVALVGFRGGEFRISDQGGDEGAEQGFAAAAGIMDELEEAELEHFRLTRAHSHSWRDSSGIRLD